MAHNSLHDKLIGEDPLSLNCTWNRPCRDAQIQTNPKKNRKLIKNRKLQKIEYFFMSFYENRWIEF
jgi:hypothetical protein